MTPTWPAPSALGSLDNVRGLPLRVANHRHASLRGIIDLGCHEMAGEPAGSHVAFCLAANLPSGSRLSPSAVGPVTSLNRTVTTRRDPLALGRIADQRSRRATMIPDSGHKAPALLGAQRLAIEPCDDLDRLVCRGLQLRGRIGVLLDGAIAFWCGRSWNARRAWRLTARGGRFSSSAMRYRVCGG